MKKPKDKRTKEYKEWKKNYEKSSEGLGDTIEKVTEATGVKKLVEWIAGEDCGCDERKKVMNRLFRYNKPLCLEEDEYNYLNTFFQTNKQKTGCSSCVKTMVGELQKVFKTYDSV